MMDMRNLIVLFISFVALFGPPLAHGFDVDGLKNGMKKEAVIEILSRRNFEKVVDKGDQIQFIDLQGKENNRYSVVTFKNDRLVGYSKNFKPSMSNYITTFKLLSEEYGPMVRCSSILDVIPAGEMKDLDCIWISPIDEVEISYSIFPSGDQLSVSYKAR